MTTTPTPPDPGHLKPDPNQLLRERARALGFDVCRVTVPVVSTNAVRKYERSLDHGFTAGMDWLETSREIRADPASLWPEVQSVVVVGLSCKPDPAVVEASQDPMRARISVHALGRDYHDILKGRAKTLGQWIVSRFGGDVRVYVDSAPVMEKPLAQAAGVGWGGKNTLVISEDYGAWLLLAEIFSSVPLPPDTPAQYRCAQCTRCMDACPTGALRAAGDLDARRCVAYLTTEEKDHIDVRYRDKIGNRIYGCDECQLACPWNRRSEPNPDSPLKPIPDRLNLTLVELAGLDEAGYRKVFAKSGVRRLGFERFRRNVFIALGNSGDPSVADIAFAAMTDPSPLVREAAAWAYGRLKA